VLLEAAKIGWGRQRFFTMTDSAAQFTPWYVPQGMAASDDFKSFPSGHSFAAMLALWFALLPECVVGPGPTAKTWGRRLALLALTFGACTMLSRLLLGMHFLSDVTCGAALSLLSLAAAAALVRAHYPRGCTVFFKI
jgi:membrane-associated phospholipid phosphatase